MRNHDSGATSPLTRRPARRTRRATIAAALIATAGIAAGPGGTDAATPSPSAPAATADGAKPAGLSNRLAAIADASPNDDAFVTQAAAAELPMVGTGSLVRDGQARLFVNATLEAGQVPSAAALTAVGADLVAVAPDSRMATIAVPVTALRDLAAVDGVRYLMEVLTPLRYGATGQFPQSGDPVNDFVTNATCATGITSEGDEQLDADDARTDFGIDGGGIEVGVISDSFDDRAGATADIGNSELPGAGNPCGRTTPVDVLFEIDDISPGESGSDEGRAMAQIVHDIAPGADLSFATAVGGEIVMAKHIVDLAEAGAHIVTDDIAYLFEPIFQDGYISTAINENLDERGVPHFTAGGNSNVIVGGQDVASYEAPAYRPTACGAVILALSPRYSSCHNFATSGAADNGNGILIDTGGSISVALGWSEPQFNVSTDLDIFIVNAGTNQIVASSFIDSVDAGRANEFLDFFNSTGGPITVDVVVAQFEGAGTPRFRHQFIRASGITAVERDASAGGDIVGPTLFGHAGAEKAITVGAVPYNDSSTPETFSSRGPNLVCWQPLDGTSSVSPINPCDETTVDMVATDGGANSFFGSFSAGAFRFFGTSAAAPHAAGVAALALSYAPCTTADQLLDAMTSTAKSVGAFGVDAVGGGLVDADATLAELTGGVDQPCISLGGQSSSITIQPDETSDPIALTVADAGSGADDVTVTATSDDQALLPDSGLVIGGSGTARTLTITPGAGESGTATVTLEARDPDDNTSTFEIEVSVASVVSTFTPARLVDTRSTGETIDGQNEGAGPIGTNATIEVQITGRGGVPDGATAAVLNVSTVDSIGNGFLTIFDCGAQPLASSINYGAGRVVNNEIVAKLSSSGTVCIFARTATHVVIDAVGAAGVGSPYIPLTPARVVETRIGPFFDTVDDFFEGDGVIQGGEVYEVSLAGRGGLSTEAVAAVLNLSTVNSVGNGFLTIFDCGTQPLASGINYSAGAVVNNEIVAKLSSTGTLCIFARTTTDLVIDVVGEMPADGYNARVPARLVETRSGAGFETVDGDFEGDGAIGGGDTYVVQIAGRGGIPADASAAVLNLSTVGSAGNGFLTIYDCGTQPLASGINYSAGSVVNNEIVAKLSADGEICIFARTATHLVVDAVGDL